MKDFTDNLVLFIIVSGSILGWVCMFISLAR